MKNPFGSKKALLIIGQNSSGKSQLAKNISKDFVNPVFLSRYDFMSNKGFVIPHFVFSNCVQDTNLIIVDDCRKDFDFELFFNLISNYVTVQKLAREPFEISPKFIFISEECPNHMGSSFTHRFEIINVEQLDSNLVKSES